MTERLHTVRLDLEPVSEQHAPEAWSSVDDDRMWTYFPALRPATLDDLRKLYAKWERGSPDVSEIWLNWMCRNRMAGTLVGSAQATLFPLQRVSYVAYAVYAEHQRKGYAREAVSAVIAHLKQSHAVERIFAEIDTRNEASYKLVERLGFARVETRTDVERGHGLQAEEYVYELVCMTPSRCRTRPT